MSELSFAKSFLSTLDSRPIKLRADYVHDQDTPRVPVRPLPFPFPISQSKVVPPQQQANPKSTYKQYLLPRLQHPRPEMPKRTKKAPIPGSSKAITVTLKSTRNPVLEIILSNVPASTTIVSDLKDAVRDRILDNSDNKVSLEKIKILYKRKPIVGVGKTVAEVVSDVGEEDLILGGGGGKQVEFGVMVMGGARVVEEQGQRQDEEATCSGETTAKAAVEPSGEVLLETEEFWEDLQGYLGQRLRDADEAEKLRGLFKEAWAASRSA
ncbi:cell-cycle control medial ring component [Aspergillus cavernicola]|uniref:Cell-cycle control medial ring component n=1 Tax=Aspergillus cavernicola TaxID=176166 RepID=A0ABR4IJX4_9EURO